jgi:hypothetical protein
MRAGLKKKPLKKIVVYTLEITALERYKQFEIKLPGGIKKISGIIITTSKI